MCGKMFCYMSEKFFFSPFFVGLENFFGLCPKKKSGDGGGGGREKILITKKNLAPPPK
jgi:hypothetical protein